MKKRLRLNLQVERAECGISCLSMIANYYGLETSEATLRNVATTSTRGLTLKSMIKIAELLSLQSQALKISIDEIDQLKTPCILHWDTNHYVILKGKKRRKYTIYDPSSGIKSFDAHELSMHFTGIALEVWPQPFFTQANTGASKGHGVASIISKLSGLGTSLTLLLVLALLLEVIVVTGPFLTQVIVDRVVVINDIMLLKEVGIALLLLVVTQSMLSAARTWLIANVRSQVFLSWTKGVFSHLIKLPQDFFDKRHLGDITTRFNSINSIQQAVSSGLVAAILDGIFSVAIVVILFRYSIVLATVLCFSIALYGFFRILLYPRYRLASALSLAAAARQQSKLLEAIKSAQTIKILNAQSLITARFAKAAIDLSNANLELQKISLETSASDTLILGAGRLLILVMGALAVIHENLSNGEFIAFVAYAYQLTSRASSLSQCLIELRVLEVQGNRLSDIVRAKPESDLRSTVGATPANFVLRLEGVSFRYSQHDPWIVKDCSAEFPQGSFTSLTGITGCGKSTLVKILLGLAEPEEGSVTLGQRSINEYGKYCYRDLVCAVQQESELFSGTILENISLFDPDVDERQVEIICKRVLIYDEICAMPLGLKTTLGSLGSTLSSGQKQRIAIARALYKRPKILILDEATCHLDLKTEREIMSGLVSLGITCIVISHRKESHHFSEKILLLRQGELREIDTDKELQGLAIKAKNLGFNADKRKFHAQTHTP